MEKNAKYIYENWTKWIELFMWNYLRNYYVITEKKWPLLLIFLKS